MLSSTVFRPPLNEKLLSAYTQNDQRGMVSEPPAPAETAAVSEAFTAYRHPPAPTATIAPTPPGAYQLVQDIARECPRRSIRFFYFVTPTLSALTHTETTPCSIKGVNGPAPIFDLARPDRFPELFKSDLWRDPGHLNPKGAAVFSMILAREVNDWLADGSNQGCGDNIAVR
jgi:hypothetical protein